jgi:hypothetical protein
MVGPLTLYNHSAVINDDDGGCNLDGEYDDDGDDVVAKADAMAMMIFTIKQFIFYLIITKGE